MIATNTDEVFKTLLNISYNNNCILTYTEILSYFSDEEDSPQLIEVLDYLMEQLEEKGVRFISDDNHTENQDSTEEVEEVEEPVESKHEENKWQPVRYVQ